MKNTFMTIFIMLLTVAILAGCGANPKSEGASANETNVENAEKEEKTYELKVGYNQSLGSPLFDIALHEGFFDEENLIVEGVRFASSADGLNALQSGKIDIGLTFGTAAPLTFISNGSDFSIIGGHLEGGHPILVQEKDKDNYKTIEDFVGKRIGTIRMFTPDIVFRTAFTEAGYDIEKDLELIEFKNGGDLLQAVSSGKIDVAVSAASTYLKALEQNLVAVMWSNDLMEDHVCCRVVTRTDLLSEDEGEAYKRFLKALIRAERVKNEHPEKAVEAAKTHLKLDDETVDLIVNEEHSNYSSDPSRKEVVKMWEQLQAIGYIEGAEDIDINSYINIVLYEKALEELLEQYPEDEAYYEDLLVRFNNQNL